jgi:hypothetical protein
MESFLSTECLSAQTEPQGARLRIRKAHDIIGDIPLFFAGMAIMFSPPLYFTLIFHDIHGSLEPELIAIYITTTFLVIAINHLLKP